jgi:hypothetical protein
MVETPHPVGVSRTLGEKLMQKLVITIIAAAAIVFAGALTWKADAQTSVAAAIMGSANKNFTPVEKAPLEQAACRGWGRHCPPGKVWTCGPRGCWCRWC